MTQKNDHLKAMRQLAQVLADMHSTDEIYDVLYAILTEPERKKIALRWELVRLLEEGMSQRAVAGALGVSLCKITRGSRELKYGPPGFRKAIHMAVKRKNGASPAPRG